jgi:hypothetical protein
MTTELRPDKSPSPWLAKPLRWLFIALRFLFRSLVVLWTTLAIYYTTPLPWVGLRLVLALAFMVFGIWALWRKRTPLALFAFAAVFLVMLVWYFSLRPSHDREWSPDVAVMPRESLEGDRVSFTGVRNFDYRSKDDFTVRYEEREVLLSHLTSVDFFVSYWMPGPVAHTFVSFNFDNAPPICVSIETRTEIGEGFSPVASLFRQFELIYVVGDERDIVRVRTNFRHEEVFLYRLQISPVNARGLFLVYLNRINELADRAEFYHLLNSSCTVNIVRYARAVGKMGGFDIRYYLNGFVDSWLYSLGYLDTSLPFSELRQLSHINEAAQAAGDAPDFSQRIRANLPLRLGESHPE